MSVFFSSWLPGAGSRSRSPGRAATSSPDSRRSNKFFLLPVILVATGFFDRGFCSATLLDPDPPAPASGSKGTRLRSAVRDVLSGIREQKVQLLRQAASERPDEEARSASADLHVGRGEKEKHEEKQVLVDDEQKKSREKSSDKVEDKSLTCAICREPTRTRLVPCGHRVCSKCADDIDAHNPSEQLREFEEEAATSASDLQRWGEQLQENETVVAWGVNNMRKTEAGMSLARIACSTSPPPKNVAKNGSTSTFDEIRENFWKEVFGGGEGDEAASLHQLGLKRMEGRMRALKNCGSSSSTSASSSSPNSSTAPSEERRKILKAQLDKLLPDWLHLGEEEQVEEGGRTRRAHTMPDRLLRRATQYPCLLRKGAKALLAANKAAKLFLTLPNKTARFLITSILLPAAKLAFLVSVAARTAASPELRQAFFEHMAEQRGPQAETSHLGGGGNTHDITIFTITKMNYEDFLSGWAACYFNWVEKGAPGVDRVCGVTCPPMLIHELVYSDSGFEDKSAALVEALMTRMLGLDPGAAARIHLSSSNPNRPTSRPLQDWGVAKQIVLLLVDFSLHYFGFAAPPTLFRLLLSPSASAHAAFLWFSAANFLRLLTVGKLRLRLRKVARNCEMPERELMHVAGMLWNQLAQRKAAVDSDF
eukprot:g9694.t1